MRPAAARPLLALLGLAAAVACTPPVVRGERSIDTGGAPRLEALPPTGTYAWIAPSKMFRTAKSVDDSVVTSLEYEMRRESSAMVLRSNGWRETRPDSAQYHLSITGTYRDVVREHYEYDPPRQTVSTCPQSAPPPAPAPNPKGQPAPAPQPREPACVRRDSVVTPPRRVITHSTRRTLSFGIRRASDGAMAAWSFANVPPSDESEAIAKRTIQLLYNGRQ